MLWLDWHAAVTSPDVRHVSCLQAGRSADEEPSAHRQRVRASLPDDESADSHLLADMNEAKEAGEAAVRNSLARLFVGVKVCSSVNHADSDSSSLTQVQCLVDTRQSASHVLQGCS